MRSKNAAWLHCTLAIGLSAIVLTAAGQNQQPRFDVISVKRSSTSGSTQYGFQPRRFFAVHTPLRPLIARLYSPPGAELQVLDGPGWLDVDPFEIEAKTDAETPSTVMQAMARALLEERFGLRVHIEQRDAPIFLLATGPQGSRLSEATADECTPDRANRTATLPVCGFALPEITPAEIRLRARRVTLTQVAATLEPFAGRRVVDRTGLSHQVSFELRIARDPAAPADPGQSTTALAEALRAQLGLRLESARGSVEVLRVDAVHAPGSN